MKLMTQEIRRKIPTLYSQDGKGMEAVAYVKFFHAYGSGTWFATEFDGKDTFFGWAQGVGGYPEGELGYFSLSELESLTARIFGKTVPGLKAIERDLYFTPTRLCDIAEIKTSCPLTEEEELFNA